ncbi:hypothetical protein [Afipia felis]|uniref:Uncharacterized protein n=2 Tax=Afipia felis TaxID=1035 RepID=A0A381AZ09_AFIFE|nr:hypothetical protein [Afipia felis]EKS26709.1 hypothetical protein HMPREF9697_04012 [Afipia felis ATCC 53690]SUU76142.1 Uncharacterised protein [Afipia felis]SUU84209.1 Uncharacterised protein [Afipia felis]SUW28232.1 Uncharacterised protein [Afipia felis]
MRKHFHFTTPESGQDFCVTGSLIAAALLVGVAANLLRIVWVLS